MRELFAGLLTMSMKGSVVILAVLLLRLFLRSVPKKITVFLWFPAAMRLVIPGSVPFRFSLFGLLSRNSLVQTVVQENRTTAMIQGTIEGTETVMSTLTPEAEITLFGENIGWMIWLAGIALMVLWTLYRYLRLHRQMATATLTEDAKNVYCSEYVTTPFIMGIFRPKIYMPYRLEDAVSWQVLIHERTHLRYGDHLTKLLAFCVLTVHWFNPLCWIAFVLYGRDLEMRCDEAALRYADAEEYSTALVKLAVDRRYAVGPLAFGETSVRERVKHILHWKKPALWISIAAVILCTVVGIVCVTDAVESPYTWTSAVTAEDFSRRDVTYYSEGRYSAELTDAQLEELVRCLRNVPESAMHIGEEIRQFSRGIRMVVDDRGTCLFWDGEKVIQSAVRTGKFTFKPAWYLDDPALEFFFTQLEQSIRNGQGTLDPQSVPVAVTVAGTDTVIAPKQYPAGTWDHRYDTLPVLTMPESGTLLIDVYWQPTSLSVYEEYYHSLSGKAVSIEFTDHTAVKNTSGSYTLAIARKTPDKEEKAIYYITHGEDKYIFKILFPASDAEE